MTRASASDAASPSFWKMLGEVRGFRHRIRFSAVPVPGAVPGEGRGVLVMPGFMVHDVFLTRMARSLRLLGYAAETWGMGLNRGFRIGLLEDLEVRLTDLSDRTGGQVSLVGWSLGGLYAREMAKRNPHLVDRVVTLATPFSGDMRANRVWRIYERVAGHPVDRPPIEVDVARKPPVPTFALWSAEDGLISPAATRGLPGERDEAVQVRCHHLSFVASPAAIRAVADVLGRPPRPS